jgi:hypothetical protein
MAEWTPAFALAIDRLEESVRDLRGAKEGGSVTVALHAMRVGAATKDLGEALIEELTARELETGA